MESHPKPPTRSLKGDFFDLEVYHTLTKYQPGTKSECFLTIKQSNECGSKRGNLQSLMSTTNLPLNLIPSRAERSLMRAKTVRTETVGVGISFVEDWCLGMGREEEGWCGGSSRHGHRLPGRIGVGCCLWSLRGRERHRERRLCELSKETDER
jgi:hypothetical protein